MHRTVVEDEHTYAVRIDDGALLDAAEQIDHARPHLNDDGRRQLAAILGSEAERLDRELDALTARARTRSAKIRITSEIRDRARNGRYAFAHDRGRDFAAGIWVIDPAFMIDLLTSTSRTTKARPRARRRTSPAHASTTTSCATQPRRTSSAAPRRAPATPRRPAATSASGTTSAPR